MVGATVSILYMTYHSENEITFSGHEKPQRLKPLPPRPTIVEPPTEATSERPFFAQFEGHGSQRPQLLRLTTLSPLESTTQPIHEPGYSIFNSNNIPESSLLRHDKQRIRPPPHPTKFTTHSTVFPTHSTVHTTVHPTTKHPSFHHSTGKYFRGCHSCNTILALAMCS